MDERRQVLQDRMASGHDHVNTRDQIRQDWQDWHNDYHDDWHHGCWNGNASSWWNHMWDEHTAAMVFGTTMWGVNRAAYAFGYYPYTNPYYVEPYPVGGGMTIDYAQPVAVEPASTAGSDAPPPALTDFDAARSAFYQGDYSKALESTNKALAAMPNDSVIHEFRALVLFAQGKYKEAAAGLNSVLAVTPGWDWTTMASLYPDVNVYTQQLRALETFVQANPNAAHGHFVLAYHYLTMNSTDAATAQLKAVVKLSPQDAVSKSLLAMTEGPQAVPGAAPEPPQAAVVQASTVDPATLIGAWSASGPGNTKFALKLTKDGNFDWTFMQDNKPQTVKGVYALDGDTLAMEPESGGVMLAQVATPKGNSFPLKLVGAPAGDPGLNFRKGG